MRSSVHFRERKAAARLIIGVGLIGLCLSAGVYIFLHSPNAYMAERRLDRFMEAVNYNRPAEIYPLLSPRLQDMVSKDGFVKNFQKERSYPYLTPLFIYLDKIEFNEGKTNGDVQFSVASRLPGEKMRVGIEFVDGAYYIDAFEEIVDGSYIEKFDRL